MKNIRQIIFTCSVLVAVAFITSPTKASAIDIVGDWELYVNWSCNTPGTEPIFASVLTFNSDNTWTYTYGGGDWYQSAGMLIFDFSSYDELIYSGNLTQNAAVGIQGYISGGSKGCWYMTRIPSSKIQKSLKQLPDDFLNERDALTGKRNK